MTSSSPDTTPSKRELDSDNSERRFLRHTLATLAYRAEKPLRNAPAGFADVRGGPDSRTAGEILAHMSDLMDWALWIARGEKRWETTPPTAWDADSNRFFASLAALDAYLASDAPLAVTPGQIFQAPIADALTHTGQLNLLRRLADAPVRGENYARAHIEAGRVGRDQSADRSEFD